MKCAWDYLCAECDNAGVWDIDMDQMGFSIGEDVEQKELVAAFGDRLQFLPGDKLFLQSFVDFQYGELNPNVNPHKPVIKRLEKLGLLEGLNKGSLTLMDKDKEKDKDKDQDQDKDKDQDQEKEKGTLDEKISYPVIPEFDPITDSHVRDKLRLVRPETQRTWAKAWQPPWIESNILDALVWATENRKVKNWGRFLNNWLRKAAKGFEDSKDRPIDWSEVFKKPESAGVGN